MQERLRGTQLLSVQCRPSQKHRSSAPHQPSIPTHLAQHIPFTWSEAGENEMRLRSQHRMEKGERQYWWCAPRYFQSCLHIYSTRRSTCRNKIWAMKMQKLHFAVSEINQAGHLQLLWTIMIIKPYSTVALWFRYFKIRTKQVSPKILLQFSLCALDIIHNHEQRAIKHELWMKQLFKFLRKLPWSR